ncbi:type II toxin-antitoxin system VapC family toxin [Candidatus Thiosymbion oneisti]|uniref:type II toxin-antitoxin system VapC family toxin n=1 Tax=Candidatus Thiosymbion oneisti TaxID=589554 RepID=UPI000AA027A8|nr:type II toxin-antitoxin system VapC family toxin [Candidatus Thiosymbion oneisti]
MEVLVDTCGWIEWLTDGVFAERFAPFLTEPESLIVPTCLQFELYKWVKRERNETLAMEIMALTNQTQVIPLTTALALYAADLSLAHRLSFADALIYATARRYEVTLVTIDDHFAGLTDVTYFPKRLLSEP